MSGLWAVLVREIRERRAIPLAALALGILPVIAGSIPALTRIGGTDVREGLAVVLGFAFPVAVALGLGVSVIGRDVAEGRLGFYFSRPISGFALWAGKMGATLILIGASALLVVLPAHLLTAEGFAFGANSYLHSLKGFLMGAPPGLPSAAALALPLLVLGTAVAHAAGTMLRSRSGLLPLDLGLLIVTVLAFAIAAWRIVDAGAPGMFLDLALASVWGALAACLVAGAIQVVVGRGDRRRGHLFLSATLWGSLLTVAGVIHLALSWAFAVAPADLDLSRGSITGAPRGSYFALNSFDARSRLGYLPTFLIDADSGHFVRIGSAETSVVFAEQGRTAVWMRSGRERALHVAQLDAPSPRVRDVAMPPGVGDGDYGAILAVSPDGARVLLQGASGVAVLESSTGRLVAEAKMPRVSGGYFDLNETVRLNRRLDATPFVAEISLLEWSLRTGQVREKGRFGDVLSVTNRQAGHLLVVTSQCGLDIRSAENGQLERTMLRADPNRVHKRGSWCNQARFLGDGGVAAIVAEKDGDHLETFTGPGIPGVDVRLGGRISFLVGESATGELVLENWEGRGIATLFVDPGTGEIRKRAGQLRAAAAYWNGDLRNERTPGSLETRLFTSSDGALVDRDPVTGARRVVVQGRKPEEE
ncbi:MAG: hypothetical protein ACHQNV_00665 [Vicinamibacteria bacterium]